MNSKTICDNLVKGNNSPLKSEFKTSKEIWVEVEDTRRTRDNSEEQLIKELQVEEQLWLSKEEYVERVEDFRNTDLEFWAFPILCGECKKAFKFGDKHHTCFNCLINKILLGKK